MRRQFKPFALTLLFVLFITPLARGQNESPAKTEQAPKKKSILLFPFTNKMYACFPTPPAEVNAVSSGGWGPTVLTSQIRVVSLSTKPIKAVRLGWYVIDYEPIDSRAKICDALTNPDKILVSGNTPLLELGIMHENQSFNISTSPLKILFPADVTVFVNSPLITYEEMKSITTDGTWKGLKGYYAIFLIIDEVVYADGTKWKAEGNPPFRKPTQEK